MKQISAWLLWMMAGVSLLQARTFYVDFAGGDDDADGLSAAQAWRHAPFDRNAAGQPAAVALQPGDTVRFKGGVRYVGEWVIEVSGAEGEPIVIDGNRDGSFGEGPAILDGGETIHGWEPVSGPEAVRGNPRWRDMFTAVIPVDIAPNLSHREVVLHRKAPPARRPPWQRVILIDGEAGVLPIAQLPKPADPFFPDLPADFFRSPSRLTLGEARGLSGITDPAHLTATELDAYLHRMVGVHGGNNHVYFANVQGFDPERGVLHIPAFRHATYPQTRWAFYNAPELISERGEWAIVAEGEGIARIFLLPPGAPGQVPEQIAFARLGTGIQIRGGQRHLVIRGLVIQRFAGGGGGIQVARAARRAGHITVEDCVIRWVSGDAVIGLNYCDDIVIRNCRAYECPGWTSSIFASRVNRFLFEGNIFRKNSGSGIRHYACKHGVVRRNAILEHHGMHASGINLYEGSLDLTVEENHLHNAIAINRNAEGLRIRHNVIDGQGRLSFGVAMWPSGSVGGRNLTDILIEHNTIVNLDPEVGWASAVLYNFRGEAPLPTGLVVRNNLLQRLEGRALPGVVAHNLLLSRPGQAGLLTHNFLHEEASELFVDAARGDFRRRPGSPHAELGAQSAVLSDCIPGN